MKAICTAAILATLPAAPAFAWCAGDTLINANGTISEILTESEGLSSCAHIWAGECDTIVHIDRMPALRKLSDPALSGCFLDQTAPDDERKAVESAAMIYKARLERAMAKQLEQ